MERKRRRMTEGQICVFALPSGVSKSTFVDAIEASLDTVKSGRVLGSGMSLIGDGVVTVEVGAYNVDQASDCIAGACGRLRCDDYEITWD